MRGITKLEDIKTICTNLIDLVDRGTYAMLPNEIKKLRQKVEKKQMTWQQAENVLVEFARKFDALADDGESTAISELSANVEPEIVLSETFVE